MKRHPFYFSPILFYSVFILSTIVTTVIVYKDFGHPLTVKFIVGYVIFLLVSLFYFTIAATSKIRKLKWIQIRTRVYTFIISCTLLSSSSIVLNYFLNPGVMDYYKIFSIALGISLGIAFFDLYFRRESD
ncbi:hypothetical protein [Bacillus sp. Marseille-Q3570]|uniref:hypothetical protein n=1 Tax=Bacillus sp. Marseille-Q3570 TaxID=2963522 RepID=UPI0021B79075|nr:hypothetical protein [Bacillus sp. Marseille-Q3570]